MDIVKLCEAGYDQAILGLSLNKGTTFERAQEVAIKLAGKGNGHDKFSYMIDIWLRVRMPRFWWPELEQYKVNREALGEDQDTLQYVFFEGDLVTSSESTMNSLAKVDLTQDDFEYPIEKGYLEWLNTLVAAVRSKECDIGRLKNALPDGYLQTRVIKMNYAVAYNMCVSRATHRLVQWRALVQFLYDNLDHPELLPVR